MRERNRMMMYGMLAMVLSLAIQAAPAVASVIITEDFATDPAARGWVLDSTSTKLRYDGTYGSPGPGPGGCMYGYHLFGHNVEGYYIMLPKTQTDADDFSAQFDVWAQNKDGNAPGQAFHAGFVNKDDWLGASGTGASKLTARYSTVSATADIYVNAFGNTHKSDTKTAPNGTYVYSGDPHPPAAGPYDFHTFVLSYIAGTREYSLSMYAQGDTGGTALWTVSDTLPTGETFALDAFGVFTGYYPENTTNNYYSRVDNVVLTVTPEPATMTLLGVGFAALCYRKRRC
jgi:hypothetical protein